MLRADRRAAFVTPLAAGLFSGFAVALWADLAGKPNWLVGGLSVAAFCWSGLLLSLRNSAWARFVVARCWLAARGLLPLRLLRFLDDAHQRGVLRRTGPVYQFRHATLQRTLAFSVNGDSAPQRTSSENQNRLS